MAGCCELGSEPSDTINCWDNVTSCGPVTVWRRIMLHGVGSFFSTAVNLY